MDTASKFLRLFLSALGAENRKGQGGDETWRRNARNYGKTCQRNSRYG